MKNKKVVLVDAGFNPQYHEYIVNHVLPERSGNIVEFVTYEEFQTKYENSFPDLVLFTGGTDVDPKMYGDVKGKYTDSPDKERDIIESHIYDHYFISSVPKLGICRGAQLLCVKNGGLLIQHVEGHNSGNHETSINDDLENPDKVTNVIITPSDHHQMMYPYNLKERSYNIVGWSSKYMSSIYLNGKNENINLPEKFFEPEIVYFNNSNSLAIQFHPEYKTFPNTYKSYIGKLIRNILFK